MPNVECGLKNALNRVESSFSAYMASPGIKKKRNISTAGYIIIREGERTILLILV